MGALRTLRPGFYTVFRCASGWHSGLAWGAIFRKIPRHALYSKITRSYFQEHVPRMVPAQNVLPRSQLDTPQKTLFLGVQFGTFSGRNQFLEVQFGTCSGKSQFLGFQFGTFSGKVSSWGAQFGTFSGNINSWGSKIHIPEKNKILEVHINISQARKYRNPGKMH